jgi:Mannosyl-glycoprotein endo-beta-N-acetylglucosaminidase
MNRMRTRRWVVTLLLLSAVALLLVSCQGPAGSRGRGVSYPAPTGTVPIMGRGAATVADLASFLLREHPQADAKEVLALAEIYVEEARIEGVNHDVAFAQMCHETHYLRFDGDVRRSQNNFAGIGATGGGAPGNSFASVRTGVRAQIQHLKAYASRKRLKRPLVDPRFARVMRGSAPYVENLTGKWAADPHYDTKIIEILQSLAAQP